MLRVTGTTYRPKLREIAPVVYFGSWGFVVFNVFFLAPAYFSGAGRGLALISTLLNPTFWGVVFLSIGLALGYGLLTNNWKITRGSLMVGLFVKLLWAYALLPTVFISFSSIGIVGLWLLVSFIQSLFIIYFVPGAEKHA